MAEEPPSYAPSKKSIFDKYDIPIDHYEFDYVRDCKNVQELEKIVKVLRSNEANYFPELLEATENRLRELDPNNRLLRVATKPLTKEMFSPEDFQTFQSELDDWSAELSKKERALQKSKTSAPPEEVIPPVRISKKAKDPPKTGDKTNSERIRSFEYDKWDKFDAEAECLKMDIQEEKRHQQLPKKLDGFTDEVKEIEKIAGLSSKSLSKVEKEKISSAEKELGNECYKLTEWKEAARHYSKSIGTLPTAVVFNNRAAAYLKLSLFEQAISDATTVVQMEPANEKALYRRAQAYEATGNIVSAIKDLNIILRQNPSHSAADKMRQKLRLRPEVNKKPMMSMHKSLSDFSLPGPSGLTKEDLRRSQSRPLIEEIKPEEFKGNLKIIEVESKKTKETAKLASNYVDNPKSSCNKTKGLLDTVEDIRSQGVEVWEL